MFYNAARGYSDLCFPTYKLKHNLKLILYKIDFSNLLKAKPQPVILKGKNFTYKKQLNYRLVIKAIVIYLLLRTAYANNKYIHFLLMAIYGNYNNIYIIYNIFLFFNLFNLFF